MDQDILQDFLAESRENLAQMEEDLVALETAPTDAETLARVFRAIHTLKGTCGFFGFARLEKLAHAGEDLLAKLRDGTITFDTALAGLLLRLLDDVRTILDVIESTNSEGEPDIDDVVDELERCASGAQAEAAAAPEPEAPVARVSSPRVVRIAAATLDRLSNQVEELVRARNAIQHLAQRSRRPILTNAALQLNRVTRELHNGVMRARMEPMRRVFAKLPRIVRDLASKLGKQVRLEIAGRDTEIDRAVLEAIMDPLTHLVRNAIDHGIEDPVLRAAGVKPVAGLLRVEARQESGHVVIEVRDDGVGIDPDAVRARAVERRIVTDAEAAALDDAAALELVFRAGLSTARKVTTVSGRGVGMDVVKTEVERMGGRVRLSSEPGFGTTVRLVMPLTLAIVNGVVVTAGSRPYVIYQGRLREFIRIDPDAIEEERGGIPIRWLRGRPLPLVYLDRLLDPGAPERRAHYAAVVEAQGQRFGLVVERILDTGEITVKPLGPPLDRIGVFAGATVLGDGTVALVLEVPAVAEAAGVVGLLDDERVTWEEDEKPAPVERGELFLLLQGRDDGRVVVPLAQVERLKEFTKGEMLLDGDKRAVLDAGQHLPLVHIASVLHERRKARRRPYVMSIEEEKGRIQVAVCRRGNRAVGLIVERILDIVELPPDYITPGTRDGVVGTIDVGDRMAECIDVGYLARQADPLFFEDA